LTKSDIGGKSIVIGMVQDKLYAIDSVCSHEGGLLEEVWLEEHSLTCPWHQEIFDIRSAKASPGTDGVSDMKSYTVAVDEQTDEISVEIS
jgi:nitrite reductase/ring-hydroxylating ferredoxin subunit